LLGNSQTRILLIEDGAVFQGSSSMLSKENEKQSPEHEKNHLPQESSKAM
jgi:cytoskeletal protein CcmA (bactofilin family)